MGVGAQKDLGGHQTFSRKMTSNFARKVISFSVHIKVISKKKGLHWNWDGLMNIKLPEILTQTCPKNMKLPKILMQYFPNNIKLPEILTLWNQARGAFPPGPPLPTPLPTSPQKCPFLGSRTALFFDWLKRKITKNSSFSIYFFSLFEKYHILWLPSHSKLYFKWHCVKALIGEWGAKGSVELLLFLLIFLVQVVQTAKP